MRPVFLLFLVCDLQPWVALIWDLSLICHIVVYALEYTLGLQETFCYKERQRVVSLASLSCLLILHISRLFPLPLTLHLAQKLLKINNSQPNFASSSFKASLSFTTTVTVIWELLPGVWKIFFICSLVMRQTNVLSGSPALNPSSYNFWGGCNRTFSLELIHQQHTSYILTIAEKDPGGYPKGLRKYHEGVSTRLHWHTFVPSGLWPFPYKFAQFWPMIIIMTKRKSTYQDISWCGMLQVLDLLYRHRLSLGDKKLINKYR